MKILLQLEDGSGIAVKPGMYIVFEDTYIDKEGKIAFQNPRYFATLESALEELRLYHLGKHLAKNYKFPAKDLRELLNRIKEFEKKWFELIKGGENETK